MFYSGIDQHKRDSMITMYDADGHLVKQARVPNDRARLRAYFAALPGPHKAVVESTGSWYWLADTLEAAGLKFSGLSPDGMLPEVVELVEHPWFIGVQFHPELKSKPFDPHPLFSSFVAAALDQSRLV